ncbi:MAG: hypothetical protein J5662_07160 [Clostridia bacterium]|nr:hypothetical protein [Clostridia bacterium]
MSDQFSTEHIDKAIEHIGKAIPTSRNNVLDLLKLHLLNYQHYVESQGIKLGIQICLDEINKIPSTDVVEVVRCKDCKHLFEINKDTLYVCDRIDTGMDGEPNYLKPEIDFCSRGKRREGE